MVDVDEEGAEPDPRLSLANERTFLAYTRTALSLLAAGLAVSGSSAVLDAPGWVHLVGVPLILLGGVLAVTSRARYLTIERAMRGRRPLPRPPMLSILTFGVGAVAAVALVALVVLLAL